MTDIINILAQFHIVSIYVGIALLLIDIIVVTGKGRWTPDDTIGSFLIAVLVLLPVVQTIITVWVVFDIIKEIKKEE